jgi:hypothetical protein
LPCCEQELDLAATDAVLSGAGAIESQCAMDQSLIEPLGLRHFLRVVWKQIEADVEIAFSGMPEDACR